MTSCTFTCVLCSLSTSDETGSLPEQEHFTDDTMLHYICLANEWPLLCLLVFHVLCQQLIRLSTLQCRNIFLVHLSLVWEEPCLS